MITHLSSSVGLDMKKLPLTQDLAGNTLCIWIRTLLVNMAEIILIQVFLLYCEFVFLSFVSL